MSSSHDDCDHDLGICILAPDKVFLCEHGNIRAACSPCLDDYVEAMALLAEVDDEA